MNGFNPYPFDTPGRGRSLDSLGELEWCIACGREATCWFDGSAWGGGVLARCDSHARQVRSENFVTLTRDEVAVILVMGS
jgi:hypothetical protein